MKCVRCGNEEEQYFYQDKDTFYCRKCIMFGRIDVGEQLKRKKYRKRKWNVKMQLAYDLTKYQKQVSKQLENHLSHHRDVLVYAATGAGKTEIVMPSVERALNAGMKVGIAISRRQVVLEIKERMQKAFPDLHVIAVCEGHTSITDGDLIVCTMHQLYRYYQTFDLLIMDEVDAFPYYGNEVLQSIAAHSCVGQRVYLTATPDEMMLHSIEKGELEVVKLFVRPHSHPLIVPLLRVMPVSLQFVYLFIFLKKQRNQQKKVLVFVPTIRLAKRMSQILQLFFKTKDFTSQSVHKDEVIADFKEGKYDFLLATTVLERGITIPGVNVAVLQGDHIVFTTASLVQIFGRVGRSMKCYDGEALLLCAKKNKAINECIASIQMMNKEGGFV